MSHELRFHEDALVEILSAAAWYDGKRPGLGGEFLETLDARLRQLATSPNIGGRFRGADPKNPIRRILLSRFPYVIVFVEADGAIRVIAVMHAKQSPGYWMKRLPP